MYHDVRSNHIVPAVVHAEAIVCARKGQGFGAATCQVDLAGREITTNPRQREAHRPWPIHLHQSH